MTVSEMIAAGDERALVRAALAQLQIDRLMLTVHDASFPATSAEDVGRGTPYSRAAAAFFGFVAARGFGGVQFGPQGKTSLVNPSPYDGSVMARSHLSVALRPLVDQAGLGGLMDPEQLERAVALRPPGSDRRAHHQHAWHAILGAVRTAHHRFVANPKAFPALADVHAGFVSDHGDWLRDDSLFEVLTGLHGGDDVSAWPLLDQRLASPAAPGQEAAVARRRQDLLRDHADLVSLNEFTQLLLHVQHDQMRTQLRQLGLHTAADFQVGLSPRDRWRHQGLFLPGYAMGAPPSRTTPQGQAWGYPVLDPDQLETGAGRFVDRRLQRLLGDFDAIRIDHPHGIVCPWVYRCEADAADAVPASIGSALIGGARLFESPHLPDHPTLARFAIAGPDDLAPALERRPRHADDWVRRLSEAQIDRYSRLMDRVIAAARGHGIGPDQLCCDVCAEVLSTCPFPLEKVMRRHGLGRVRVTQKANPDDPGDPYRSATAAAADWITLGTHDTPSIWAVVDRWQKTDRAAPWARYLADRLAPSPADRAPLAQSLVAHPHQMVTALAADLFAGPARHVSIFFSDLLGLRDDYNVPGTINPLNWTLRVPPDFATQANAAPGPGAATALDLPAAVAMALRAQARGATGESTQLAAALERRRS